MKNYKLNRESLIVALVFVSESELQKVNGYYEDMETNEPALFYSWLSELGADITRPIEKQKGLKHRNRLNEVVKCNRWVCEERLDPEWINSGYASKEAIDKYSNNRILEDLYRSRNLTVDAQIAMENRDKYTEIDESYWE